MQSARGGQSLPSWVLPLVVVLGVAGITLFGWKVFSRGSDYVAPAKEIRPGTYNLREEVAKMQSKKAGANSTPDK